MRCSKVCDQTVMQRCAEFNIVSYCIQSLRAASTFLYNSDPRSIHGFTLTPTIPASRTIVLRMFKFMNLDIGSSSTPSRRPFAMRHGTAQHSILSSPRRRPGRCKAFLSQTSNSYRLGVSRESVVVRSLRSIRLRLWTLLIWKESCNSEWTVLQGCLIRR